MEGVNKIFTVAGGRGKGKTTFEKEEMIRRTKLPKTLIVEVNDSDIWHNMKSVNFPEGVNDPITDITLEDLRQLPSGISRLVIDKRKILSVYKEICYHVWNTLILFEDCRRYIKPSVDVPEDLDQILIDTKQRNNHVLFSFHALIEVPRDIIRDTDYLTLFKTGDPEIPTKWKHLPDVVGAFEALQKSTNKHDRVTLRIS